MVCWVCFLLCLIVFPFVAGCLLLVCCCLWLWDLVVCVCLFVAMEFVCGCLLASVFILIV